MTKLVVVGHGGYGTSIREALEMLLGPQEHITFIDFTKKDDVNTLREKLRSVVAGYEDEVLFVCDLSGGTPFRESAMLCIERPKTLAVGGFNLAALLEVANNLDLSAEELIDMGIEVTNVTIHQYPEKN